MTRDAPAAPTGRAAIAAGESVPDVPIIGHRPDAPAVGHPPYIQREVGMKPACDLDRRVAPPVPRRRAFRRRDARMRSSRFGRAVVKLRWVIAAAWVAAAVVATVALPSIEESQDRALGDLVPDDAAAIDAEIRSSELFGFPLLSRTIVVQRDPAGLGPIPQAATLNRAVAINRDTLPDVAEVGGAIPVLNTRRRPALHPRGRDHGDHLPALHAGRRRGRSRRPRRAGQGPRGARGARQLHRRHRARSRRAAPSTI